MIYSPRGRRKRTVLLQESIDQALIMQSGEKIPKDELVQVQMGQIAKALGRIAALIIVIILLKGVSPGYSRL